MYAGVTNLQVDTDKMDELQAFYRDTIVPPVGQQPGLQGVLLLTDRSTGNSISVGLWDTEAQAVAYRTGGMFQNNVAALGDMRKSSPARALYEVIVHKGL